MKWLFSFFAILACLNIHATTDLMTDADVRKSVSLNGEWSILIDPYCKGEEMRVFENKKAQTKTEFYEYSFDGAMKLKVPGDWNHQIPSLDLYEGTVWYARHFSVEKKNGQRLFLYFSAVSTRCNVFLNGRKIGNHEGGFTPFQIEVTKNILQGDNFICVEVNNERRANTIPALVFDWWNYGGITRDVMLVSTPAIYIDNYSITLDREKNNIINICADITPRCKNKCITLSIPELKNTLCMTTNDSGQVHAKLRVRNLQLWSPDVPKLYKVVLTMDKDTITNKIGFRTISTHGEDILLNGKPIFMRSVSFHEEIASECRRAYSREDAQKLLNEVKKLGCNMVRLAHYPQNENIIRKAEEMGIILWEEVPVWQSIDFSNNETLIKALKMLEEMICRDINRCSICFWGLSNETKPSVARNNFLQSMIDMTRRLDKTRLIASAFDVAYYNPDKEKFVIDDKFIDSFDVVGINKYMGWYAPWPRPAEEIAWDVARGHPLIITEFGGEALQGNYGHEDWASSWSEDYQAELYKKNIRMFKNIPNLRGVSPWVLYDFRSPFRFLPGKQDGWNRKGLLSDKGQKKKAWSIIHDYYLELKNTNE